MLSATGAKIRQWKHVEGASTLFFVLYLVSQASIIKVLGKTGEDLIELQLTYDLDAFRAVFARWTTEDAERFLAHFPYDFVHPFIYATSLVFGLAFAFRVAGTSRWDWMILTPYVAAAADLLENIFYLRFFRLWQADPASPALSLLFTLANGFCAAKWLVVAAGMTFLIGTWVWKLVQKIKGAAARG